MQGDVPPGNEGLVFRDFVGLTGLTSKGERSTVSGGELLIAGGRQAHDVNQVAPGWYPDPEHLGTQRFWDGAQWTEQRAPIAAQPQTVVMKKGGGCLKTGLIVLAVLAVLGIGLVVALGAFASKVSDEIDKAETAQVSIVAAGGVAGDAGEVTDVVPDGSCVKDEFGLITWPFTVNNSSSKISNYFVTGVIEQGSVKVGDLNAFVQNVSAGQTAKEKLTSLDTVEGEFTCRIVKVDRTSAN